MNFRLTRIFSKIKIISEGYLLIKEVLIMCMYCKNTTTVPNTTTHVVNYKNCVIVIKNVPCLECDQCGEKYYTDEVAEKLELLVDMAKKLMQEIAVIDYKQAA